MVNELQPEEFPGHKYVKQEGKNNTVIGKEHEQRNTGSNEHNKFSGQKEGVGAIRIRLVEQRVVFGKEQEIKLIGWQRKDLKLLHTMT